MKVCTKCNENKDETLFYFDKKKSQFISACKVCTALDKHLRYKKNRDRYRATTNARRQTPEGRYCRTKGDAKQRNILFTITKEEFINLIKLPCYYCNNKLGDKTTYGGGLDRLDNFKGYELDNVVSCCHFCNTVKNYLLTPEEMKKVSSLLINERGNVLPIGALDIKSELIAARS